MPLMGIIGHNPNVRFDPRKFTWLGSSSSYANDAYLLIARKDAAVKSIEDARRARRSAAGARRHRARARPATTCRRCCATRSGSTSSSSPAIRTATRCSWRSIARRLDGRFVGLSAVSSSHPEWLKPDSGMQVLLQFARVTRHPQFPDVPTARELARDDRARALIELAELPYRLSRPFAAPPGLPPDRAKALQAAFLAVHQDPQYLDEAGRLKVDVSPIGGEEVLRAIDGIAGAPPELLDYMRKLLSESKNG